MASLVLSTIFFIVSLEIVVLHLCISGRRRICGSVADTHQLERLPSHTHSQTLFHPSKTKLVLSPDLLPFKKTSNLIQQMKRMLTTVSVTAKMQRTPLRTPLLQSVAAPRYSLSLPLNHWFSDPWTPANNRSEKRDIQLSTSPFSQAHFAQCVSQQKQTVSLAKLGNSSNESQFIMTALDIVSRMWLRAHNHFCGSTRALVSSAAATKDTNLFHPHPLSVSHLPPSSNGIDCKTTSTAR